VAAKKFMAEFTMAANEDYINIIPTIPPVTCKNIQRPCAQISYKCTAIHTTYICRNNIQFPPNSTLCYPRKIFIALIETSVFLIPEHLAYWPT
jgi:hypothetical protein